MFDLAVVDSSGNVVGSTKLSITQIVLIALACVGVASVIGALLYKNRR